MAKLTLNKWPDGMDWRKKNGQQLCDRRMEGTAEYVELDNAPDYALSASRFPEVITAMMARLSADARH